MAQYNRSDCRNVWKDSKGAIPKGYHIHHLDFNWKNDDLDNLICISRKEHADIHLRLYRETNNSLHAMAYNRLCLKGEHIKGYSFTDEHKENISISAKNRTDEAKQTFVHSRKGTTPWNKGIPHTDEARKNISNSLLGHTPWNKGKVRVKIECPHCGIWMDKANSKRYHGDNCKSK